MAKSKYKPEYCELIKEHMAEGNSLVSFAAKVGVAKQTLHEWFKSNPDFYDAKKNGEAACQRYWEDMGKKMAPDNPAVWIFNMKARFGWKESSEVTLKGEINHKVQLSNMDSNELKDAIEKELP